MRHERQKNRGRHRQGRGFRKRGFFQSCLLLALHREDAHGYSLLNSLETFGFDVRTHDPSMIYRILREMEDAGWIVSYEGKESLGPRRRVYRITEDGRDYLKALIEEARRSRQEITLLIDNYEQNVEKTTTEAGES